VHGIIPQRIILLKIAGVPSLRNSFCCLERSSVILSFKIFLCQVINNSHRVVVLHFINKFMLALPPGLFHGEVMKAVVREAAEIDGVRWGRELGSPAQRIQALVSDLDC
jgi:hypothetical protein